VVVIAPILVVLVRLSYLGQVIVVPPPASFLPDLSSPTLDGLRSSIRGGKDDSPARASGRRSSAGSSGGATASPIFFKRAPKSPAPSPRASALPAHGLAGSSRRAGCG